MYVLESKQVSFRPQSFRLRDLPDLIRQHRTEDPDEAKELAIKVVGSKQAWLARGPGLVIFVIFKPFAT